MSKTISRKVSSLSILAFVILGGAASAQSTKPFPDVPKDHWAYQAVMELKQKGILIGYPDGSFNGEGIKPAKPIYDISTPMATLRTLIAAMRNRDEWGVQYTLTFHSNTIFYILSDTHNQALSPKERMDYYERIGKQWSKDDFYAWGDIKSGTGRGVLTPRGMPQFGFSWFFEFIKTDDGWKISKILFNDH